VVARQEKGGSIRRGRGKKRKPDRGFFSGRNRTPTVKTEKNARIQSSTKKGKTMIPLPRKDVTDGKRENGRRATPYAHKKKKLEGNVYWQGKERRNNNQRESGKRGKGHRSDRQPGKTPKKI